MIPIVPLRFSTLLRYQAHRNKSDAMSKELQIKSGKGKAYLRQRVERFLALTG